MLSTMVKCYDCKLQDKCKKKPEKDNVPIVCADFRHYRITHRYCFSCKKVTTFGLCDNCGRLFCLSHAPEETEGSLTYRYHERCG